MLNLLLVVNVASVGDAVINQLGIREMAGAFKRRALLVASLVLGAAICGALLAVLLQKKYEASAQVLVTAGQSSNGGLSSALSQLGGIASLAGVSVGGGEEKTEAITRLKSEDLARRFIADGGYTDILIKAAQVKTQGLSRDVVLIQAAKYFCDEVRTVYQDTKTGVVTVAVSWTDPEMAARWVNDFVAYVNEYMKKEALADYEANLTYLTTELSKAGNVELRAAVASIVEAQVQKQMLARGSNDFAFKVVDPAVTPLEPSFPKMWLMLAVGVFLGFFLAVAVVMAKEGWLSSIDGI